MTPFFVEYRYERIYNAKCGKISQCISTQKQANDESSKGILNITLRIDLFSHRKKPSELMRSSQFEFYKCIGLYKYCNFMSK